MDDRKERVGQGNGRIGQYEGNTVLLKESDFDNLMLADPIHFIGKRLMIGVMQKCIHRYIHVHGYIE